jgi:anaerobic magnesium-protoporphyrin IX monomethyl ester cyclase
MRSNKKPRFLFIQPEGENVGVQYLSASLKLNKFEVDLLFLPQPFQSTAFHIFGKGYSRVDDQILNKIREYKPDVVCFSPFSSQYVWATAQAKMAKSKFPGLFILFGGVHVNSVPGLVIENKYIDAIIVGEADYQIVEFAKKFYTDKLLTVPSLWIKKGKKIYKNPLAILESDLDKFPMADKEIFYKQIPYQIREEGYLIMGSRGCPFHCAYCSNNVYEKLYQGQKRLRFRSPENIIKELRYAKAHYKPKMVEFFDDVLTVDEPRLRGLLKLYRRYIDLPFTCYLHPQLVTERIIKLLAKSNCYWLKIGIQSANEKYRKTYLNRYESNAQVINLSKLCHKYHLAFSLDHIFNLPGETEDDLVEAVKLYNICRPTIINFGTLYYLPGTDILKLGIRNKILTAKDVAKINQGMDPVFKMANVDLISYQYRKNKAANISVFALLFMMISIFPPTVVDFFLKIKLYRLKFKVPQPVIVLFKIMSKIRAKQLYIYRYVLKTVFYYGILSRNRSIL